MINFVLKFKNPSANSCLRSLWSKRFITKFARELLILKLLCFIHTPVTAQVKTQFFFTNSAYSYMAAKENISLQPDLEINSVNILLVPHRCIPPLITSTGRNATHKVISGTFKDANQRRFESMGRPVLKYRYWC